MTGDASVLMMKSVRGSLFALPGIRHVDFTATLTFHIPCTSYEINSAVACWIICMSSSIANEYEFKLENVVVMRDNCCHWVLIS